MMDGGSMTPERLEEIREHNKEDRSEAGMLSMLGDSMAKEMTELLAHIDEQAEQLANVREVLKGQKAIGFREGYELAKERIGAERDRLQRIVDRINGQLVDGGENPLDELDRQITALEGKLAIARDALKKYLANWEFDSDNPKPLREALEQIREKEGA